MKRILNLMVMAVLACCMMAQDNSVEGYVNRLMDQYPKARLLDIYKSCFQDFMGAEHLVGDTASVRAYLEQEMASTRAGDLMPWYYEPCGMHGEHVRVSLRAVIEGKIDAQTLLKAFIASASAAPRPTVQEWTEQWHSIIAIIDSMGLNLPCYEQDKQEIEDVLSQGKYAISHSPEYREAYRPHYRIVKREVFEQCILPLLPIP